MDGWPRWLRRRGLFNVRICRVLGAKGGSWQTGKRIPGKKSHHNGCCRRNRSRSDSVFLVSVQTEKLTEEKSGVPWWRILTTGHWTVVLLGYVWWGTAGMNK